MITHAEELARKTGAGAHAGATQDGHEGAIDIRRQETRLKTGALQDAIFNSVNFSSIATDENGVIQIFNVGAERMLGYAAADVMNKITPADISDPQEVIARARALSAKADREKDMATTIPKVCMIFRRNNRAWLVVRATTNKPGTSSNCPPSTTRFCAPAHIRKPTFDLPCNLSRTTFFGDRRR